MEPQMQQFIPQEPQSEADRLQVMGNIMQHELALRHGEELGDFIDKHAEDFRNLVKIHPEYIEEFYKDPEATLQKIESTIYH